MTREGPVGVPLDPADCSRDQRRARLSCPRALRDCTPRATGRTGCSSDTRSRSARRDPMLGKDVGFYMFRLPFLEAHARLSLRPCRAVGRRHPWRCTWLAGRHQPRPEPWCANRACGEAPSGRARRRAVSRARLRRVPRRAAAADDDRPASSMASRTSMSTVRIPALRVLMVAALLGAALALLSDGRRVLVADRERRGALHRRDRRGVRRRRR